MPISTDHSDAQPGARLPPGTRLNGIFEIDEHLSAGGMGDIYRGHAIENGEPVAIKLMRSDLADDETALALFRKEARALHSLHHEAIVRYFVFSNDPGIRRHYLAMEFVHGDRLSHVAQRHRLDFDQVRQLQRRLAAALHEAHRNGIIHRDVSPDNVLVPDGDVGRAKIIDFGIARSIQSDDTTIIGGGFAGKYNYVSPEQVGLFGGEVTAQSDIYSLGLVLAECLLGQPIDMRGNALEVVEKRRVVPDLRTVDPRFQPLLTQMLQPNPKDRPMSMAAVAAWQPPREAHRASHIVGGERKNGPRTSQTLKNARPKWKSACRVTLTAAALALLLLLGNPIDRIVQFVNTYEGGDCFWVVPVIVAEQDVTIYGLGNSGLDNPTAPFHLLDREFRREIGFDATIEVNLVKPAQCAAVTFLSRTRGQSSAMPRLDIDEDKLRAEGILAGSITAIHGRYFDLLLVADDGTVRNLMSVTTSGGATKSFEIPMPPFDDGLTQPQLLLAAVSNAPLAALNVTKPSAANAVFARAHAEALEAGQQLTVGVKYFRLGHISRGSSAR
jgi:serine/threonine-protein kinase